MLSYFMRTYCIREKYEKNPHNFNLYITTTSTLLSTEISTKNSIIQQFTIEYYYYYKKSFNKTLFSYKKGYRTQQKISSRTTTKSLYAKGSKIIKEDKLSESSISNLQKNTLNDTSEQELYRKYNMQEQQHNQQHPTTTTKTYSNQESNKIGAENSIEGKFEIFYYSNSKFNITTNLLQLLSTKQFILSENNNIKSISEILTKNNIIIIVIIILHKVKIKKLIYLLVLIVSCTVVQFRQNKSSKIFTMIPTLINLTEIVLVGVVETNSAIKELSNNEIGLTALNGTTTSTMKPSTTIMSTIIDNSYNKNNNFSYIETLRNNIIRNDYSAMSDEFNETFTPAMSQVILAPTVNSAIYFQTPCTVATVASGSTSNSFQIGANGTDDGINSFYFYETEQFALLWVLFTVIVLGNSAVLVTLFMNKNRKSRMNFFIKQLALADICVGLLNVLTDIIWRITVSWRAGNIACKIIRFSQVCVTYASTYVLVALSIDRYDAITHPMNFSGSWQRARRLVISAWTVSAIFSAPMLILYEEKLVQGQTQCWIELGASWRWQLYMSLVAITLFVFPALIISACYAIIVRTIWVKGSVFIPSERSSRNSACLASRRASSRGIIPRAKVKTVKMTFVIVIVFVVCWSPYIIFDLLQVFNQIPRTQTNIAIATFIQSLAPLNSAANPLIYCLFSTQVCRALKRIPPFRWILCSCCCQTQGHNSAPIRCTTVGQRLHNSCDSMRTLTTSLNVSRRSNNCMRPARVVIVERPKTILAMSEV